MATKFLPFILVMSIAAIASTSRAVSRTLWIRAGHNRLSIDRNRGKVVIGGDQDRALSGLAEVRFQIRTNRDRQAEARIALVFAHNDVVSAVQTAGVDLPFGDRTIGRLMTPADCDDLQKARSWHDYDGEAY